MCICNIYLYIIYRYRSQYIYSSHRQKIKAIPEVKNNRVSCNKNKQNKVSSVTLSPLLIMSLPNFWLAIPSGQFLTSTCYHIPWLVSSLLHLHNQKLGLNPLELEYFWSFLNCHFFWATTWDIYLLWRTFVIKLLLSQ